MTFDIETATKKPEAAQHRAEDEVPKHDTEERTGVELSPLVLPMG